MLHGVGALLTVLSLLAGGLGFTAVPAVIDIFLIAFGLACAAIVVLVPLTLRRRRLSAGLFLLVAMAVGAWTGFARFYSYTYEHVTFPNGDVSLAGTLYLPRVAGPHPAAVFVHGSGPESRKEYAYYAQRLARGGIASLVYDKRGVGASTGSLYATGYAGLAEDAAAAMGKLRMRDDIDPDAVGLIGFSEGEWTAPLAAVKDGQTAYVVIIGASGVTPAEQVNQEIAIRMRSRGYSQADIDRAVALNNRIFAYQRNGEGADSLQADLLAAREEDWFQAAGDIPDQLYPLADYKWWRSVMDFDPAPVWSQLSAPVLVLKGGRDDRSSADIARRNIGAALKTGGNENYKFIVYPEADHLLLEWPLGERVPPPFFAPGYLDGMRDWILENAKGAARNRPPSTSRSTLPPARR